MTDVLLVVGGLRVEVGEIGEQQHDEDHQGDEQPDDLRTGSGALQGIAR
jgi:hypothetical protein